MENIGNYELEDPALCCICSSILMREYFESETRKFEKIVFVRCVCDQLFQCRGYKHQQPKTDNQAPVASNIQEHHQKLTNDHAAAKKKLTAAQRRNSETPSQILFYQNLS